MTLPVQITYREMAPLPALEAEVHRRAAKLAQWMPVLKRCELTVWAEANRRHQGHDYHLTLTAEVPQQTLVVDRRHGTELEVVVRDAFDAMDRQLEDHARRLRRQVKQHAPKAPKAPKAPESPESPEATPGSGQSAHSADAAESSESPG
jgi:ribosome-associated translation inhibitor RaiA